MIFLLLADNVELNLSIVCSVIIMKSLLNILQLFNMRPNTDPDLHKEIVWKSNIRVSHPLWEYMLLL